METDKDITDAEALKLRRERLRAFADRLLEAVEMIPMPDNFLDSERAHKAVRACDAMLVQLYAEPVEKLPSGPRTTPPRASATPDDDDDADLTKAEREESLQQAFIETAEIVGTRLDRIHQAQAKAHGYWADGTAYDPADPDYGCEHKRTPQINVNTGMDDHCTGCWPNGTEWAINRPPRPRHGYSAPP